MDDKKNKIGLAVKGSILAIIMGFIVTGGGIIKIDEGMTWMTMNQYRTLRDQMFEKYENKEVFSVQEMQLFAVILNKELQDHSVHELSNVNSNTIIQSLINKTKEK